MIEPHAPESSDILYALGRIALGFGLIALVAWIVTKLIVRSGKRGLSNTHLRSNRQQRRVEEAKKTEAAISYEPSWTKYRAF